MRMLFYTFILLLMPSCGMNKSSINGIYRNQDQTLSLELNQKSDSIVGNHCFIFLEGEKIDCCEEQDGFSLRLKKVDDSILKGTIKSCYDEEIREVQLSFEDNYIQIEMLGTDYPFSFSDTIKLYRE